MSTSQNSQIDLASLFGTVAKTLTQSQTAMNDADTYNHDHGDNMVETFNLISKAIQQKKDATPATQLSYASEVLQKKASSGSAKLYSEGLSDAAKEFAGKDALTSENATQLVQLLLGVAPAALAAVSSGEKGNDLLGSLLNSFSNTATTTSTSSAATATTEEDNKLDVGDLVNAGLAFFQAKQSGGSNMDALMSALTSSSKVGTQDYRAQSGALVANALLQAVSTMVTAKK
jgi:hypothetical protein